MALIRYREKKPANLVITTLITTIILSQNLIWHNSKRFESKHFKVKQSSKPTEFIKITFKPNTYHKGGFGVGRSTIRFWKTFK